VARWTFIMRAYDDLVNPRSFSFLLTSWGGKDDKKGFVMLS